MRVIAAIAVVCSWVIAPGAAQVPPAERGGTAAPPYVEASDRWLSSPRQDDDQLHRAVAAVLDGGASALQWLGDRMRGLDPAANGAAAADAVALRQFAGEVTLAFVDRQRDSGVIYRGQYAPLQALQPFVVPFLFDLLLRTPDWFADTRRVHLAPVLADLQPTQPAPELLLGVTDLIENVDIEPADLRQQLAFLVWQWGRKEYVERRADELRQQSAEGDAEDRLLALRAMGDLWYRVREYDKACSAHATLTAMADSSGLHLSPTDWYWGACYRALAGRLEPGLDALQRCAELLADPNVDPSRRLPRKLFLEDPEIALLRADPRFAAILRRAFPERSAERPRDR